MKRKSRKMKPFQYCSSKYPSQYLVHFYLKKKLKDQQACKQNMLSFIY